MLGRAAACERAKAADVRKDDEDGEHDVRRHHPRFATATFVKEVGGQCEGEPAPKAQTTGQSKKQDRRGNGVGGMGEGEG